MSRTLPPQPADPQAGRQRLRLAQSGLAVAALLLMHVLLLVEVNHGHADAGAVAWFIGVSTSVAWGLYYLVRSGWSERLSREPSLSMPQMVDAQVCTVWAYALAGPARGALLALMPLILAFGLFALDVRTARVLAILGVALLGAVCGGLAYTDPVGHPWRLEAEHWLFTSVAMGSVSVLAGRLGRMRERLRQQKAELSEALERIRALATRDPLTGLLNRRAMAEELQRESRSGRTLALALVDLDHFKRINDTHGHAMGDKVLQRFAEVARAELRDTDLVARWGGEEFLLMLPQASAEQAVRTVARLRQRLLAQPVGQGGDHLAVTFSAGVALSSQPDDLEAAVERADLAMYRAKTGGRDRTECAPEAAPPATREVFGGQV